METNKALAFPELRGGVASVISTGVYSERQATETVIVIEELENGRVVRVKNKRYIVPFGTPLINVIGQALVTLKLEG